MFKLIATLITVCSLVILTEANSQSVNLIEDDRDLQESTGIMGRALQAIGISESKRELRGGRGGGGRGGSRGGRSRSRSSRSTRRSSNYRNPQTGYMGYGYGGGLIIMGGYGYAYGNQYSYMNYSQKQDRSCHVDDCECQDAARAEQLKGVITFFVIAGICVFCIICCCCWKCKEEGAFEKTTVHTRSNGDVVTREVEVREDSWGGEEVIVHEHIQHNDGRGHDSYASESDDGGRNRRHGQLTQHPGGIPAGGMPPPGSIKVCPACTTHNQPMALMCEVCQGNIANVIPIVLQQMPMQQPMMPMQQQAMPPMMAPQPMQQLDQPVMQPNMDMSVPSQDFGMPSSIDMQSNAKPAQKSDFLPPI